MADAKRALVRQQIGIARGQRGRRKVGCVRGQLDAERARVGPRREASAATGSPQKRRLPYVTPRKRRRARDRVSARSCITNELGCVVAWLRLRSVCAASSRKDEQIGFEIRPINTLSTRNPPLRAAQPPFLLNGPAPACDEGICDFRLVFRRIPTQSDAFRTWEKHRQEAKDDETLAFRL
ncbi:LAFE_0C01794g1_1 [Lachancea fermentati]|uniref:LAFE_0C01794g1_1 n=1 Tax=Lachancea fermentati TaxID=4955 RepID=A0A1G4M8X9_LACFM|nr:LAFE_0C01794g1_1 [Lachancea fermentati]